MTGISVIDEEFWCSDSSLSEDCLPTRPKRERLEILSDTKYSASNILTSTNIPLDCLHMVSKDCRDKLNIIISMAKDFCRYDHRQKVTVEDFKQAFKLSGINFEWKDSDDSDNDDACDNNSIESDSDSESFICYGTWLRKPEPDTNEIAELDTAEIPQPITEKIQTE
ncbi:hypothetical protein CEXT_121861 [Caerostris extrusa]|uniref:Uncharacterized protein n=1 Tax=Caerostris extrusa TaxID=172846 RepID=A0AAV4MA79_CAEEX|nr:hypothetical protein CEXT_121861 [Caerostris extrusa]